MTTFSVFERSCQRAKLSLMQYWCVLLMVVGIGNLHGRTLATIRAITIFTLMFSPVIESKSPVGSCWMEAGSNGRCRGILQLNVTWESCCADGNPLRGWTTHTYISSGQHFLWERLSGGAPGCQRCRASCEGVRCGAGEVCRMRQGAPRCVCEPQCQHARHLRHSGAKCGTDGRTYKNMCSMLRHNCRHDKHVEVNYSGPCKATCALVTCETNKHCVHDQQGEPHCVPCGQPCSRPSRHSRVCGSDGQTYMSFCHLQRASCLQTGSITVAYHGRCQDGASCETIQCKSGDTCVTHPSTAQPHCISCGHECTTSRFGSLHVCGTDGKTYDNWCELRRQMCRTRVLIRTAHTGRCGTEGGNSYPEIGSSASEAA